MPVRSVIAGVGSALPRRQVSNAELAETVDTSDQWIVERTGIRSRYIAGDGETTGSLATDASRAALESAGVDARDIGLIVLATATPDQTFPSTVTVISWSSSGDHSSGVTSHGPRVVAKSLAFAGPSQQDISSFWMSRADQSFMIV